jgi:diguanylate cyclase
MRTRYLVGIVAAILISVAYFLLQSSELLAPLTDCAFVLASGFCSILVFLAIREWGFRGKFGVVYLGLFLGMLLWFLGDTAWTIYAIALQIEIPYPSFADILYLAGYVPIAAGIIQFLWTFRTGLRNERTFIALGVGILSIGLTYAFLIGPLVGSTEDFLTKSYDVAYPVLDSLLVVLAVFMFFLFSGGKMAGAWFWISLGLFLTALADMTFSLGTLQGWYFSGHPIELIQFWGYIALALGFDEQRETN